VNRLILLLFFCASSAFAQTLNEFLAANATGIRDEDNAASPWIEIWNPNQTSRVSMLNWKLSNGTTQWTFPGIELQPDEHLIVWASGKDRRIVTAPLHTNFTLPVEGGTLSLLRPDGSVFSTLAYPAQQTDVSFGRDKAVSALTGFYTKPTPGDSNNYTGAGVAGKVVISVPSRAFTGTLTVELAQATPDPQAEIRYTTTGAAPGPTSPLYTAPFAVSTTQLVRARIFTPGLLPGEIESAGYLQLDTTTAGFNTAMPVVVFSSFGATIPDDGDLPGFMWVFEPGADGRSRLLNQAASTPTIATRVALDKRGSSTLGNPKFNLNVEARKSRDNDDRDIALLGMPAGSDWVFHAPYDFDRTLIHNPFAYALSRSIGRYAVRTKMAEVFVDVGASPLSTTGINDYFGVYNVMEKIRRAPERVNIAKLNTYDNGPVTKTGGYIIKVDRLDPGDGGIPTSVGRSWVYYEPKEVEIEAPQRDPQEQYLISYLNTFNNAAFSANYTNPLTGYRAFLDVPAAVDHHLLNVWSFNVDALRLSGYAHKERGNNKLIFGPVWDFDRALYSTDGRDLNPATWRSQSGDQGTDFFNYTWWNQFFKDPEFYQAYIDRWQSLRRGAFSPAAVNALIDQLNGEISSEAVSRDLSRWGRSKRSGANQFAPFTSYPATQAGEIGRMKEWLQVRANFMDSQWVGAVTILKAEGNVAPGTTVTMVGPAGATIYYTTDGSDPRPAGGAVPTAANVFIYTEPITITGTTRLRARAYKPNHTALTGPNNPPIVSKWSGRSDARFATDALAAAGNLVVTEINYHPAAPTATELSVNPLFTSSDFEFIEVKNVSSTALDLGGVVLSEGIDFSFTGENALSVPPGGFAVIASNPQAFAARYGSRPGVVIVGPLARDLDNGGERLVLKAADGEIILDFTYDDAWYAATDGAGNSLVLYDQAAAPVAYNLGASWRASAAVGGSPGADEPPFVTTMVPSLVTATSAQLNAEAVTNGTETVVEFVLAGVSQGPITVPAGSPPVFLEKAVTSLSPHTLYSYRVNATNALGSRVGDEISFMTLNRDPVAENKELHILTSGTLTFLLSELASDPDNDPLTITSVADAQLGTVTSDGERILFEPSPQYDGNASFAYTVEDQFGGVTTARVRLRNAVPVAVADTLNTPDGAVTADLRLNDTDADNDPLSVLSVTQGSAGSVAINPDGTITYTPGPAFSGNDSFVYKVTDGVASAVATVTVRGTGLITRATVVAGTQVPGQPQGTVYARLDLPSDGLFAGTMVTSTGQFISAIFASDGTVLVKSGDPAPGIDGAVIQGLGTPNGQAVLATLAGAGVNASNNKALLAGLTTGQLRIAARTGDPIARGARLKKILSFDGGGATVFFRAKLAGPLVERTNDLVLAASSSGEPLRLLAREGGRVNGTPITGLATLVGARGTLAEGRWRAGGDAIGVRLTFSRGRQATYTIPATASSPADWIAGVRTGSRYESAGEMQNMGLPGFGVDGFAVAARLGRPSTSKTPNSVLRQGADADVPTFLAFQGTSAPGTDGAALPGITFAAFSDPVAGADGTSAFAAAISGAGVNAANRNGLWFHGSDGTLRLLARAGDLAPGGGRWESFLSLALPDLLPSRPVFTALLGTLNGDGVDSTNHRGLWGVDKSGVLRVLLRTGQAINVDGAARQVATFIGLTAAPGSVGAQNGFDEAGNVVALVTFNDGVQAIVRIVVP